LGDQTPEFAKFQGEELGAEERSHGHAWPRQRFCARSRYGNHPADDRTAECLPSRAEIVVVRSAPGYCPLGQFLALIG
jgi:hypothetical protein